LSSVPIARGVGDIKPLPRFFLADPEQDTKFKAPEADAPGKLGLSMPEESGKGRQIVPPQPYFKITQSEASKKSESSEPVQFFQRMPIPPPSDGERPTTAPQLKPDVSSFHFSPIEANKQKPSSSHPPNFEIVGSLTPAADNSSSSFDSDIGDSLENAFAPKLPAAPPFYSRVNDGRRGEGQSFGRFQKGSEQLDYKPIQLIRAPEVNRPEVPPHAEVKDRGHVKSSALAKLRPRPMEPSAYSQDTNPEAPLFHQQGRVITSTPKGSTVTLKAYDPANPSIVSNAMEPIKERSGIQSDEEEAYSRQMVPNIKNDELFEEAKEPKVPPRAEVKVGSYVKPRDLGKHRPEVDRPKPGSSAHRQEAQQEALLFHQQGRVITSTPKGATATLKAYDPAHPSIVSNAIDAIKENSDILSDEEHTSSRHMLRSVVGPFNVPSVSVKSPKPDHLKASQESNDLSSSESSEQKLPNLKVQQPSLMPSKLQGKDSQKFANPMLLQRRDLKPKSYADVVKLDEFEQDDISEVHEFKSDKKSFAFKQSDQFFTGNESESSSIPNKKGFAGELELGKVVKPSPKELVPGAQKKEDAFKSASKEAGFSDDFKPVVLNKLAFEPPRSEPERPQFSSKLQQKQAENPQNSLKFQLSPNPQAVAILNPRDISAHEEFKSQQRNPQFAAAQSKPLAAELVNIDFEQDDAWASANAQREVLLRNTQADRVAQSIHSFRDAYNQLIAVDNKELEQQALADIPQPKGFMCCRKGEEIAIAELSKIQIKYLALAKLRFEPHNSVHVQALTLYWQKALNKQEIVPIIGPHWKELGFQSEDPTTDLRSSGVMGLLCLLYLVSGAASFKDALLASSVRPYLSLICIRCCTIALDNLRRGNLNSKINSEREVIGPFFKFFVGLLNYWCSTLNGPNLAVGDVESSLKALSKISSDSQVVYSSAKCVLELR
jgi:hypothetical protein